MQGMMKMLPVEILANILKLESPEQHAAIENNELFIQILNIVINDGSLKNPDLKTDSVVNEKSFNESNMFEGEKQKKVNLPLNEKGSMPINMYFEDTSMSGMKNLDDQIISLNMPVEKKELKDFAIENEELKCALFFEKEENINKAFFNFGECESDVFVARGEINIEKLLENNEIKIKASKRLKNKDEIPSEKLDFLDTPSLEKEEIKTEISSKNEKIGSTNYLEKHSSMDLSYESEAAIKGFREPKKKGHMEITKTQMVAQDEKIKKNEHLEKEKDILEKISENEGNNSADSYEKKDLFFENIRFTENISSFSNEESFSSFFRLKDDHEALTVQDPLFTKNVDNLEPPLASHIKSSKRKDDERNFQYTKLTNNVEIIAKGPEKLVNIEDVNVNDLLEKHSKSERNKNFSDQTNFIEDFQEQLPDKNIEKVIQVAIKVDSLAEKELKNYFDHKSKKLFQQDSEKIDKIERSLIEQKSHFTNDVLVNADLKNGNVENHLDKNQKSIFNLPESIKIEDTHFSVKQKQENTIELTIEPYGMGKLKLEIVSHKGTINAHIVASDSISKNFIEQNLRGILDALAKEGLSIGNFSVFLGEKRQDDGRNREYVAKNESSIESIRSISTKMSNKSKNRKISLLA